MILKGKRVYIREYTAGDFDGFYRLASDPVTRELSVLNTPAGIEDSRREFEMIMNDRNERERKRFIFGIFLKQGDKFIAEAGFEMLKMNSTGGIVEIGYFLDKNYWGQGYATEIAMLLIEYCFTSLPVHKVIASCDKRNIASEKVMIKCGMKKEAEFALQRYKRDAWYDELKYGILKEDWEVNRKKNPQNVI